MKKIIIIGLLLFLQLAACNLQPTAYPSAFASGQEQFIYDSHGRRDPFAPLMDKDGRRIATYSKAGSVSDLVIEGIIYDAYGDSVVIINDMILKEGESVSGATVKEIKKHSVVLSFKGKDHEFNVKGEDR